MNRRSFLLALASATALGVLTPYHRKLRQFNESRKKPLRSEMKTLAIMAPGVYPDIDEGEFISFLTNKLRRDKSPKLRSSLAFFAKESKKRYEQRFNQSLQEATVDTLTAYITRCSEDKEGGALQNSGNIFIDITLEAAFASPIYGGNRGARNWENSNHLFNPEWMNG